MSHSKQHFSNTPSHSTKVIAPTEDKQINNEKTIKELSDDRNLPKQNSKGKSLKEAMFDSCFQVINETIGLVRRYKENWK